MREKTPQEGLVGVGTTIQLRRALVQRFVALYAQAAEQQKEQVFSAFVLSTGYHPRYGKWLLTHSGENNTLPCAGRPQRYGPDVQQAWNAANRICSKRLVPFLPELIESLECRAHLLALSASTADRLLRVRAARSMQGLSTTRAGTLLKQQIPIRSSFQWNEANPGFLEGDLVARCGKGLEGTFLYTLTLTDVATGWTECLPVMGRSRELVLAAFQHARNLFPFPILGLDTDCGGEFLNEDMGAYCEREQILLTRGRPYLKNDQAYVEQKNGHIVRQVIGHDRYDGEYASQQIAELYRAWRLYVNCFQPSMKLVVPNERETPRVARHDPAKTPLQRVLLSGILAPEREQEWLALARALDPVRLLKQVEQLQQAVFRCAVGVTPFPHRQPATPVLRFHEHLCQTGFFSRRQERPVEREPTPPKPSEPIDPLIWPRTRRDPFQGEWEYILFCVQAMPELTGGALLRHLQRRSPGRYQPGHVRSLQRGLRHLRAALPIVRKYSRSEMVAWEVVPPLRSSAPVGPKEENTCVSHPMPDAEGLPQARPIEAPSSPEEKPPSSRTRLPHVKVALSRTPETRTTQSVPSPSETLQVETLDSPLARAIQAYLQEHTQANRSPKTLAWHRVALGFLQRYLHSQQMLSLQGLTRERIQSWIMWLQEMPGCSGAMRTVDTVVTYARSARAFCGWLVHKGLLARSPFSNMAALKADPPPTRVVEPERFAHPAFWLSATGTGGAWRGDGYPEEPGVALAVLGRRTLGLRSMRSAYWRRVSSSEDHAPLWSWDKGAADRARAGESARTGPVPGPHVPSREEALHAETWLFRTERGDPLTNNAVTLLFARINQRAGMPDAHITPSMLRETFAVRYLQAGGQVNELQVMLGLHDRNSLKRYQQAAGQVKHRPARRRRRRKKQPRRVVVSGHS